MGIEKPSGSDPDGPDKKGTTMNDDVTVPEQEEEVKKENRKEKPVMPDPPSWATVEPEDAYHARSKSGEVMSSGMLKTFRDCPEYYRRLVTGKVKKEDTNAFRFGRAVHKIVLEGIPAFNKAYTMGGPVNPKTGKNYGIGTQAHDAWLVEKGIPRERCLTEEEGDTLVRMARTSLAHVKMQELLDYGWPELVARANIEDIPCQARFDWLTHDASGNYVLVDVKTTADITYFQSDAIRYKYLNQLAFYRSVFRQASGLPLFAVWVFALEKAEPFRAGAWIVPEADLDLCEIENNTFLHAYRDCLKSGKWPTGYEETRTLSIDYRKGA